MSQYSLLTWLPMPSRNNMKKNRADHIGARGIRLRARGYAMKARPGPA